MDWTIIDRERPWTANAERRMHYHQRARLVRETRERWGWLVKAAKVPELKRISIEATPLAKNKKWRPDVAACYPAVKAAIDGIVDAGVIYDDDDRHLVSVTFYPVKYGKVEGLAITIREE
ncbi:MAG: hypothetical protein ACO3VQ_05145 [Ilumatobacteraceae bacterium]